MKIRRVISLTSLVAFIVLGLTGIVLFIVPQGRVAYWSGWTLLGLSKEQYAALHTSFMLLFLITAIWHIVLNWRPIVTYLKDRARRLRIFTPEFNVAFGLGLVFFVGTLLDLPPFQQVTDLGDGIKGRWERALGAPPWGHAEENSLARFSRGLIDWERVEHKREVELRVDEAVGALRAAGLEVRDEKQKLIEIAKRNHTTPQTLLPILRAAARPVERAAAVADALVVQPEFPRPLSGLGRMTLREYAERYGVELDRVLALLERGGARIDPDQKLKNVAAQLETDPAGVIDLLNARTDS